MTSLHVLALLLPAALLASGCGSGGSPDPQGGSGGNNVITGGSGGMGGSGGAGATGGAGGSATGGSATGGSATGGSGGAPGGAGGSGGAPSDDPCAGASNGGHCGSELGGLADHQSAYQCQNGVTAQVQPCAYGCDSGGCLSPPVDPCESAMYGNGAYCGGSLSGGDPGELYVCQNGNTASKTNCPSGCSVQPPGFPDVCAAGGGNPCANAVSGNGLYCGSSLGAGDANTLYDCQNLQTASSTQCAAGCKQNPPGNPDECFSSGGGTCCLEHPPGVLTQSYSACGGGGVHYGIDYGAPMGTPLYAGLSGTVVKSVLGFPNCYSNGCSQSCWNSFNYLKLKSDCGDPNDASKDFYIYYLHVDDLAPGISDGDHVDQNQLIAYVGNSGCSSGPHVHIETASVAQGGNAVLNTCASVDPATRYCN